MINEEERNLKKDAADFGKKAELNTIIGKGTTIEGSIKLQNSLRVDGKIKGNVNTPESIVVGKDGEINGEITVGNAVVGGKVEGKIEAKGKVVLESKSSFSGEMITAKLVIDEGAFFDGQCTMSDNNRERKSVPKFKPYSTEEKEERTTVQASTFNED